MVVYCLLLVFQGIYVLQDNSFRWLLRLSPATAVPESARSDYISSVAQQYLDLPYGIIRGALGMHLPALRWLLLHMCGPAVAVVR